MSAEILDVNGNALRLTMHREAIDQWHWMLAAPGELLLSGTANDPEDAAVQARHCANGLLSHRGAASFAQ